MFETYEREPKPKDKVVVFDSNIGGGKLTIQNNENVHAHQMQYPKTSSSGPFSSAVAGKFTYRSMSLSQLVAFEIWPRFDLSLDVFLICS